MADLELTQFDGHTAGPWAVGPWFDNDGQPEIIIEHATPGGNIVPAVALGGLIGQEANARLIAAAPYLLAEVKRQAAEIERLRAALDAAADEINAMQDEVCGLMERYT